MERIMQLYIHYALRMSCYPCGMRGEGSTVQHGAHHCIGQDPKIRCDTSKRQQGTNRIYFLRLREARMSSPISTRIRSYLPCIRSPRPVAFIEVSHEGMPYLCGSLEAVQLRIPACLENPETPYRSLRILPSVSTSIRCQRTALCMTSLSLASTNYPNAVGDRVFQRIFSLTQYSQGLIIVSYRYGLVHHSPNSRDNHWHFYLCSNLRNGWK
jgi:hypothetical protein